MTRKLKVFGMYMDGDIFDSHGSKHSRSVMILIQPTSETENINITSDTTRRLLMVSLTLQDESFCLANVYVANDQNLERFFNELESKLRPFSNATVIPGGDYNCSLESIDKTSVPTDFTKRC